MGQELQSGGGMSLADLRSIRQEREIAYLQVKSCSRIVRVFILINWMNIF